MNWADTLEELRLSWKRVGIPPQQNGKYAAFLNNEQILELLTEAKLSNFQFNVADHKADPDRDITGLVGEYNGVEVWDWEKVGGGGL